jgi:hypothetical protein
MMNEPTMVERLAKRWGAYQMTDYDEAKDDYFEVQARWWLRAIAEEIDANPDTGFFPVADWFRSEADR